MKRCLFFGLASVLFFLGGCKHPGAGTLDWVRVETEDLIIRTDVKPDLAVELARKWQRLRNAIADNELPCAFERRALDSPHAQTSMCRNWNWTEERASIRDSFRE